MRRQIQMIINHWTAGDSSATVESIRRMHKAKGWRDIAYHRVILHPDGCKTPPRHWSDLVKLGRSLNDDLWLEDQEVGAHTLNYNSRSVGVCTVGNVWYPLHPLQREALLQVNKIFVARFKLTPQDVYGHRDKNATQCPGDEIYKLLLQYKAGAV